jgi:hypothetical protein
MVISPTKTSRQNLSITMGAKNTTINAVSPKDPIRYLGVYFTAAYSIKTQKTIVSDEIRRITSVIRCKSLTIDQVTYINNRVLIPRLEYRLATTFLSWQTCHQLFTPMTKVAKQAMKLPCTAHTNIVTHSGSTGLLTLYMNMVTQHFTELTLRVNDNSLAADTTLLRLRAFQLKHKLTTPT